MKRLSWSLIILLIAGCTFSNEEAVLNKVETEFKNCFAKVSTDSIKKSTVYMVIPRAGCGGCISSAESFMVDCLNDSVKHDRIYFILTNFDSEKILRARFGDYISKYREHILIDKEDYFTKNLSLKSMYPTIFFVDKQGALNKVREVSPKQDGISEANKFIDVKL